MLFRLLALLPAAALAGCGVLAPGLDGTVTGSIAPAPAPVATSAGEPVPSGVTPDDWIAARQALAEALAARDAAPSVPWENTATATRGTVTPLASKDDGKCRAFLVSFVRAENEDWLQGEACRTAARGWRIGQARMLERS
ncbi:RT0821/Lpp0805 family surface protein [Ancylobacter oerskovii]|uniref:RT0821/Lpp0805 family surface protein n=1 Tax=Ancylobacter oerskovii TaxID=459519 RepID=A0ABW4YTQ0_9HYPH